MLGDLLLRVTKLERCSCCNCPSAPLETIDEIFTASTQTNDEICSQDLFTESFRPRPVLPGGVWEDALPSTRSSGRDSPQGPSSPTATEATSLRRHSTLGSASAGGLLRSGSCASNWLNTKDWARLASIDRWGSVESLPAPQLCELTLEYEYAELARATKKFSREQLIGGGHMGKVYKGTLEEGLQVAVKTFAISATAEGGGSQQKANFEAEVRLLSRCSHPNVVMLLGFAVQEDYDSVQGLMVYELLPGGNAFQRLHPETLTSADATFTTARLWTCYRWRDRLRTVVEACRGLAHLHKHRPEVFHRDVKSANILFSSDGTAKIGDFGLACASERKDELWSAVRVAAGTPGYGAPEYVTKNVVTEATEVYSMGMVLFEMLSARAPAMLRADGRSFSFLLEKIMPDKAGARDRLMMMLDPRADWPLHTAAGLSTFALLCVHAEPLRRPTFREMASIVKELLEAALLPQREKTKEKDKEKDEGDEPGESTMESWKYEGTDDLVVAEEQHMMSNLPESEEIVCIGMSPSETTRPAPREAGGMADALLSGRASSSGSSSLGFQQQAAWFPASWSARGDVDEGGSCTRQSTARSHHAEGSGLESARLDSKESVLGRTRSWRDKISSKLGFRWEPSADLVVAFASAAKSDGEEEDEAFLEAHIGELSGPIGRQCTEAVGRQCTENGKAEVDKLMDEIFGKPRDAAASHLAPEGAWPSHGDAVRPFSQKTLRHICQFTIID
eukprot:TRINITY_DN61295_c0_g1_i3.p1 TRINITY_DN61295_c0_g1~~TRINITY_DN61295_c0_g1_i3.p1  ORF type:complete len:734 (+),score=168.45 TRINITY_DN61295_c0_g1_i3:162-2363(+)